MSQQTVSKRTLKDLSWQKETVQNSQFIDYTISTKKETKYELNTLKIHGKDAYQLFEHKYTISNLCAFPINEWKIRTATTYQNPKQLSGISQFKKNT